MTAPELSPNTERFRDASCPRCFHREHREQCRVPVNGPGWGKRASSGPCGCLTLLLSEETS